jgi:DNA-binding response OmpR family regulator
MKIIAYIITDNANIKSALEAHLAIKEVNVITNNGSDFAYEIIQDIEAKNPDFVILDLALSKNDGFEILYSLKNNLLTKRKNVFTFAYTNDIFFKKKSLAIGSDAYLSIAEVNIEQFLQKIFKILYLKSKFT